MSDGVPSEMLLRNQVEMIIFNALGISKCEGQFANLRNSMVYALIVAHRAAAPASVGAEGKLATIEHIITNWASGDADALDDLDTLCQVAEVLDIEVQSRVSVGAGEVEGQADRVEWLFRKKLGAEWAKQGREWLESYDAQVNESGRVARETKSLYSNTADLIREMVRTIETLALKPDFSGPTPEEERAHFMAMEQELIDEGKLEDQHR